MATASTPSLAYVDDDVARGFDLNEDRAFIRERPGWVDRLGAGLFAALCIAAPIGKWLSPDTVQLAGDGDGAIGRVIGIVLCLALAAICVDGVIRRAEVSMDFRTGAVVRRRWGVLRWTTVANLAHATSIKRDEDGDILLVGDGLSLPLIQYRNAATSRRWGRRIAARTGLRLENIETEETA